ncbi:hypothetical protein [Embleya scabrispora]|uniref:hypothetical protein n=1 Tax=Embleya scabrispora TaxID=159449 RepID=UPI00037411D9|nr:hypothetical protein [Embleya scabrispora]MYS87658.1 hypothetical protein [Streptomyces sp. SID5474]
MHQPTHHPRRRRATVGVGALILVIGLGTGGSAFAGRPPTEPLAPVGAAGGPADPAPDPVRPTASRPGGPDSTRVSPEWTFASSRPTHPSGSAPEVDGLSTTRITGDFDPDGRAPAGRPFVLRLGVAGSDTGGPAPDVRSLGAEASFDGGTTWHRLTTMAIGGGGYVALVPPTGPGSGDGAVALRTTVRDARGNDRTQTVIRAYTFARP